MWGSATIATKATAPSSARAAAEARLARTTGILGRCYLAAVADAKRLISLDVLEGLIVEALRAMPALAKAEQDRPAPSWYEGAAASFSLLGQPFRVIWVDLAQFSAQWAKRGEFKRAAVPGIVAMVEASVARGVILAPPVLAKVGSRWAFLEGMARYWYARAAKAEIMPLAMPAGDVEAFGKEFGGAPLPTPGGRIAPQVAAGQPSEPSNLLEAMERVGLRLARHFAAAVVAAGVNAAAREKQAIAAQLAARANKLDEEISVELGVGVNVGALAQLNLAALALIREMSQEQLEVILRALQEGTARGINPREMARTFRDAIGLTTRQQVYIDNYRRALEAAHMDASRAANALGRALRDGRYDRSVAGALRRGEALSQEKIDQMVNRYRERWIAHRAETIARTEALRAAHAGELAAWDASIAEGDIKADEITATWHTARDERVRHSHRTLEGQKRKHGEAFQTYFGTKIRFPGDPEAPARETINCRCVLTRQISEQPLS